MSFLKGKNPDEQIQEIERMFRRTFSSRDGKVVLGIILEDLHFFAPCDTIGAQELRSYATILLQRCGALKDTIQTVDALIDTANGA